MQKRQQALQEVGCAAHPTLREPDPLSAYNTDALNYRLLGRLSTSINLLGKGAPVHSNSLGAPRVRMAGSAAGLRHPLSELSRTRERESCECQALQ